MRRGRFHQLLSSRTAERIVSAVLWLCVAFIGLTLLHFGRRVLVCDRFVIRGQSMSPTLRNGQGVWVNKLLMGPRIYTRFDFSEEEALRCVRLPGLRRLRAGDVAVFNSPEGWNDFERTRFQLNYVYAKRCLGAAGDTVGARAGHYYSSGADPTGIPAAQEARLQGLPDSVLAAAGGFEAGYFAGEHHRWTIKDFGPLVVPARGMRIRLDSAGVCRYAKAIEYETGTRPVWADGRALLDGRQSSEEYVFRKDWAFFVGDNVADSRDSRYLGFVPEEFVVGVLTRRSIGR